MSHSPSGSIRARLRTALTTALKGRDRQLAAVFRDALGAIDNAEAVPVGPDASAGAIEDSPVGVGRSDLPRLALSEAQMRAVVRDEAAERRAAADAVAEVDPGRAQRLRREADLLEDLTG